MSWNEKAAWTGRQHLRTCVFHFIEKLCDRTVVKPAESREHKRSVAIDRVLTGKYTAIPCFVGIMGLVFVMTFNYHRCLALSDWMAMAVDWCDCSDWPGTDSSWSQLRYCSSLVVDGIFKWRGKRD